MAQRFLSLLLTTVQAHRYIVGFPGDVEPTTFRSAVEAVGGIVVETHEHFTTVELPTTDIALEGVRYMEPDHVVSNVRPDPDMRRSEPRTAPTVNITDDPYSDKMMRFPEFWKIPNLQFPTSARICIVDDGVLASHDDLRDYKVKLQGWPFGEWDSPTGSHGTKIIGGMFGKQTGVMRGRVTPIWTRMVRSAANDTLSDMLVYIEKQCRFSDGGLPDIISLSFTHPVSSTAEQDMFARLRLLDIVIVASAGNDHSGGVDPALYPTSYDDVISVASVDRDHFVSSFSQRNAYVDISAPGGDIFTIDATSTTSHVHASGTSYSAPLVAVGLALLRAVTSDIMSTNLLAQLAIEYGVTVVSEDGHTAPDGTYIPQDVHCERPVFGQDKCGRMDVGAGILNMERAYQKIKQVLDAMEKKTCA